MAKVGKRIRDARAKVDRNKAYPLDEAIKLVKETASVKFDETVDIAVNLRRRSQARRSGGPWRLPAAEWLGPDCSGGRFCSRREG